MSEVTKEQFPPLMRRLKTAEYVREVHFQPLEVSTLATMATRGGGPPYHRIGSTVLYARDDVDRWAHERLGRAVRSTSELRQAEPRPTCAIPEVRAVDRLTRKSRPLQPTFLKSFPNEIAPARGGLRCRHL